ncbi:MAG: hypothetical protein ABIR29_13065 [Chthoniobacterales bacterium]
MIEEPIDTMADNDPLLALYLQAQSDADGSAQLTALFNLQAGPVIEQILRGKRSSQSPGDIELEDVASAARENLLRQLSLLRSGAREEPIRDFRAYVASVTYSAWAETLRARHPQRALLLNRLRYLLENRTAQKGFGIWEDDDGAKWCGFTHWRGRTGGATPKRHWLLVDPAAAAGEALPGMDPASLILPELIAGLFRWLGGPIELRDLTNAVSELLGYAKNQTANEARPEQIDPRQSPAEELVWKDYLAWLWQEIGALSERQRRAFLLHSEVLRDFELLAIASLRSIALSLQLPALELAELWNRIPLDDLTIAKMIDCTRQQVINLRRVARDKLGQAWREWNAGNKGADSPSTDGRA